MRLIHVSKTGIAALGFAALMAGVALAETPEASETSALPAGTVDKGQPGDDDYTTNYDGYLYVYEHENYEGDWCSWYGAHNDYRYTHCGNWNDVVSAVWNNDGDYDARLFEHINYEGHWLCLPAGTAWSWMPNGWNDRVSSHNWGAC